MAKGTIVDWNEQRKFGFIQPEGTTETAQRAFFHRNDARRLPPELLRFGTAVEYSPMSGKGGKPAASDVRLSGDPAEPEVAITPATASNAPAEQEAYDENYRFLNPYNFVRYLDHVDQVEAPPEAKLMGRCVPPSHDRWVGLSGRIECQATAVTPVFVADAEGITPDPAQSKHKHYRFFRMNGAKAIPAAGIRGPIRSIFELITNSCFANFADTRLSYRLETRDARRLVPARIEKIPTENNEDGDDTQNARWVLRLLNGTAQLEVNQPPRDLYSAGMRLYKARKPTGRRPSGPPPPPVDLSHLGPREDWHGKACWAVLIKLNFPPSWRVVNVFPDETAAENYKAEQTGKYRNELAVQRGWLCVTNQNADNKHSERFFFAKRQTGQPETIPLPKQILTNYQDLIKDYQDRHARTVEQWRKDGKDPRRPHGDDMAFSRFILNRRELKVRGGDLVYVLLRGRGQNLEVLFIAPVSVPRVAYERTIGDLLPDHMRRCDSEKSLCPACRTFGWVHGGNKEGAYAGRVRFSHARLEMPKPRGAMRLAILGSPKPTTTRFYLLDPDGKPSSTPREDRDVGYDGNNGNNQLRGRKLYRHHRPQPQYLQAAACSDQNRTIEDPEDAGAIFKFSVDFENLAPVELGALLWALEVGGLGYHRIGYGKPLGLGSLEVKVNNLRLRNFANRYAALTNHGWSAAQPREQLDHFVSDFQGAMVQRHRTEPLAPDAADWPALFNALPHIQELSALIGRAEPTLPVHYPKSHDRNSKGQFEWFVGNKRLSGPKIELALATEDHGLPLMDKQGNVL